MYAFPPPMYILELCEASKINRALISNSQSVKMTMSTCGYANNIAFNFYSWFNMFMPRKTSIFVMIHKMAVKSICDDYLFEHSEVLTAHCDCRCQCQLSRSERMKR